MPSETPAPPEQAPLHEQLAVLRDALKARARAADSLRKALGELDEASKLQRVDLVVAAHKALAAATDLGDDVVDRATSLAAELEHHLRALRRTALTAAMQALEKAAAEEALTLELVGENPPVVLLAPFTVELDLDQGRAELQYARSLVSAVPLDAAAIVAARRDAMAAIRAESLEPADFFDLLHAAYRVVLVSRRAKPGERVELVDLLPALALLRVETDQWRRTPLRRISDYPRYLLSYQLNRLRRDGMLEKAGLRIELGTATGGTTRNKLNVLYLPLSPADGQYYLSIRFASV